ncbi:type II secretion system protein N [Yersinia proxima]|uniref:type II secretion system protein N n=1 Tax=Yersinia proxima TaxID=2890316 RepID=UPI001D11B304|nr:type II secretion system protein N [Yersinia proxima]
MLSVLNRISIAPYKLLVNRRVYLLGGVITICIFYQIIIGYNIITGKQKRIIPVLYEESNAWHKNNKLKMINEIKNRSVFKENFNDKNNLKILKNKTDIINSPSYTGIIKLVGVLEYTEESSSIAILELNGKQNLYSIGDKIDNSTIIKILKDKVIISENKSYYSLMIL